MPLDEKLHQNKKLHNAFNEEFMRRKELLQRSGRLTKQAILDLKHELNAKYFGMNTNSKFVGPVKPTSTLNPYVKSPMQSTATAKITGVASGALGIIGAIGMIYDDYNDDGKLNFSPPNNILMEEQLNPCPNGC